MKVLLIFSGNSNKPSDNRLADFLLTKSFIVEQVNELISAEFSFEVFAISGKGIVGYLKNIPKLRKAVSTGSPDIIHAHYGLSGLLAIFQRKVPVIITFHGSDINNPGERILSSLASLFSRYQIFVSQILHTKIYCSPKSDYSIIPCGIDLKTFHPIDKKAARKALHWDDHRKIVLFSSFFANKIKNPTLAKKTISLLKDVELVELKNKTREQVNLMINACDVVLLTSFSEGSPQIIKEAMACNCPIVSTNVGDVKQLLENTEGCFLCGYDPKDVADKIELAFQFNGRTNGRERIVHLDNKIIAKKIRAIYLDVAGA